MIYALGSVLLNAFAQLAIKYITRNNSLSIVSLLKDPLTYLIGILYLLSIGLWFVALRILPVSKAYPLQSLGYVFVTVIAWFVFSEKVNIYGLFGLVLICAGAFLVTL
jgi:undecaprenyl phosphate-alpha-L-ara4N flippase subunit ArnF